MGGDLPMEADNYDAFKVLEKSLVAHAPKRWSTCRKQYYADHPEEVNGEMGLADLHDDDGVAVFWRAARFTATEVKIVPSIAVRVKLQDTHSDSEVGELHILPEPIRLNLKDGKVDEGEAIKTTTKAKIKPKTRVLEVELQDGSVTKVESDFSGPIENVKKVIVGNEHVEVVSCHLESGQVAGKESARQDQLYSMFGPNGLWGNEDIGELADKPILFSGDLNSGVHGVPPQPGQHNAHTVLTRKGGNSSSAGTPFQGLKTGLDSVWDAYSNKLPVTSNKMRLYSVATENEAELATSQYESPYACKCNIPDPGQGNSFSDAFKINRDTETAEVSPPMILMNSGSP